MASHLLNPTRHPALADLLEQLRAIADLESINNVLDWDQSTYMPPGGAEARARQMALVSKLIHERQVSPQMRASLDALSALADDDGPEGALVRRSRRAYERAARLPADYVVALREHAAASYVAWTRARPTSDFAVLRPYLEKTLALSRRIADYHPEVTHCADSWIDLADPGMTVAKIRSLFTALRARLVPFVQRLVDQPQPDCDFLAGHFDKTRQLDFGRQVIERLGYDFQRGRQDETHHPFMTRFSSGDVRITTRVREDDLSDALFSTIHEAGHALYEQHIEASFDGTPLGHGASMGLHESQSRLWENMVARSRPFWQHFYPKLQRTFPDALGAIDLERYYRAINRVERSLIRTDADEVTYNLHVMLRFDLEIELLEGNLAVRDLPDAWNARMREDLGIEPPNAASGVLQDVHWFAGTIGGAFQGYTLGNLMAAQLYRAAVDALPNCPEAFARGSFDDLRIWLTDQVYRHGDRYDAEVLIERTTGKPLSIEPFMDYLEHKYGAVYS